MGTIVNPGCYIFYAHRTISVRKKGSIDANQDLPYLIKRLDRLPGITTREVGIKGQQNETFTAFCPDCGNNEIKCPKCDRSIEGTLTSEKGVDASIISYLFDTIESWDLAYVFSNDGDFAPAVIALRRKGKMVFGVGIIKSAASILTSECYQFIDLEEIFNLNLTGYKTYAHNGCLYRLLKLINDTNTDIETLYYKDNDYFIIHVDCSKDLQLRDKIFAFIEDEKSKLRVDKEYLEHNVETNQLDKSKFIIKFPVHQGTDTCWDYYPHLKNIKHKTPVTTEMIFNNE